MIIMINSHDFFGQRYKHTWLEILYNLPNLFAPSMVIDLLFVFSRKLNELCDWV